MTISESHDFNPSSMNQEDPLPHVPSIPMAPRAAGSGLAWFPWLTSTSARQENDIPSGKTLAAENYAKAANDPESEISQMRVMPQDDKKKVTYLDAGKRFPDSIWRWAQSEEFENIDQGLKERWAFHLTGQGYVVLKDLPSAVQRRHDAAHFMAEGLEQDKVRYSNDRRFVDTLIITAHTPEGAWLSDIRKWPLNDRAVLSIYNPGWFAPGGKHDLFRDDADKLGEFLDGQMVEATKQFGKNFISGVLFDKGIGRIAKGLKALALLRQPALRRKYETEVRALGTLLDTLRSRGNLSSEQIARVLWKKRRQLGMKYKYKTPPEILEIIYRENVEAFGDKYGPSVEWLRGRGKTWEQIAESSTRPGKRFDFNKLKKQK